MPPCRTFIVEDSAIIKDNLTQALEEVSSVVVVGGARTEVDAVRWLTDHRGGYDLVIVDVFLQAGSGLGVLRAARTLMDESTRIVLTNYATSELRRVCLDLGAAQVFDKSTQIEELFEFCRQVGEAVRVPTLN